MNNRIFSIGYRRLENVTRHHFAPWPIARTALQLAWRRRATKVALLACFSVVLVHASTLVVQVLLKQLEGQASGMPAGALEATLGQASEILSSFVRVQFYFCSMALAVIAAGFISEDRSAGAFDLYFARPLTRMDYALGKCLATAAIPCAAVLAPALLLWLTALGGSTADQAVGILKLGLPTLAGSLCATIWLTGSIIGLSALGEKARTVGAVSVGMLIGLSALGEALPLAGHTWAGYFSPERDFRTVVAGLIDVGGLSLAGQFLSSGGQINESAWASFFALLAQAGAGFGALAWRLRREVVG